MKINKGLLLSLLVAAVVFTGCEDLEVENLNAPSSADLLSDATTYAANIDGQFGNFWGGIQYSNPHWGLSVGAQTLSASWGNWGGRDIGTIPRQALQNNLTYGSRSIFTQAWNGLYAVMGPVNQILGFIRDGAVATDGNGADVTQQTIANAKALQGLCLGYISLLYDQAYVTDEDSDPAALSFVPYGQVNDAAITKLEEAIALFSGSSYVMNGWNGNSFTGDAAADVLRAFVAKFEALQARNLGENTGGDVDWAKVLTNAQNAPANDLAVAGDGGNIWWSRVLIQGQDGGWARVSQKVIKMMNQADANVPYPWPDGVNTFPDIANPVDNRMTTDFVYDPAVPFPASRGYYFYGNYVYKRYDAFRTSGFLTNVTFLAATEVDLLEAEALIRTGGNKITAAGLINTTRVNRGGLPALTGLESDQELLDAITYERLVEYSWDGVANGHFYRRMITPSGNQDAANLYYMEPATARHLPVPADELSIFGLEFYTFGGNQGEQ